MSEKAPAFQWYPKDCDTSEKVRAMDDREFGFYVRCLNHSWLNGGLPVDPGEIMRVIGRPASYIEKVWPRVSPCFQLSPDGLSRLVNPRQEAERKKQQERKGERSRAGVNGNEKRWSGHRSVIAQQSLSDDVATDQRLAKHRSASASASASATAALPESSVISGIEDEPPPAAADPDRLAWMRESLANFPNAPPGQPDAQICQRALEATKGASLERIGDVLLRLHRRGARPESWGFFPEVLRRELNSMPK